MFQQVEKAKDAQLFMQPFRFDAGYAGKIGYRCMPYIGEVGNKKNFYKDIPVCTNGKESTTEQSRFYPGYSRLNQSGTVF
jgi:hypothetical protein